MRKLLLVMLVPVLVLGVMGCGGIDADVQTDYQIQGAWRLDDYTIYINAATLVVKYVTEVSTPYRTEFSYVGSALDVPVIGDITLFNYQTNEEIASMRLSCEPGQLLTISAIDWNVEEYYYRNAFPVEGVYYSVGDALAQVIDPIDFEIGDFAINPAALAAQTKASYVAATFADAFTAIKKANIAWSGIALEDPEIKIIGFISKASFDTIDQDDPANLPASLAATAEATQWSNLSVLVNPVATASLATDFFVVFDVGAMLGYNAATNLYLPFTLKGLNP